MPCQVLVAFPPLSRIMLARQPASCDQSVLTRDALGQDKTHVRILCLYLHVQHRAFTTCEQKRIHRTAQKTNTNPAPLGPQPPRPPAQLEISTRDLGPRNAYIMPPLSPLVFASLAVCPKDAPSSPFLGQYPPTICHSCSGGLRQTYVVLVDLPSGCVPVAWS